MLLCCPRTWLKVPLSVKDGRVGWGPGHGLTDLPSSMASLTQTRESFLEEAKLGVGGGGRGGGGRAAPQTRGARWGDGVSPQR